MEESQNITASLLKKPRSGSSRAGLFIFGGIAFAITG
jgi:hypothetical protein